LTGTLAVKKQDNPLELEFLNFNIACPPAKVMPLMNGKPIRQLDGKDLVLEFYHTQTLVSDLRAMDFWDYGQKADVWGSLLIPEQIYGRISDDRQVFLRTYFKNRKAINFIGKADRESIEMDEITTFQKGPTWVPLFMVPVNEKSRLSRYHLSAAPK
jgi:hypothetical protein